MAPRWCEDGAMLAHVGSLGRYLGSSWGSWAPSYRQNVARWRQDGPTWRPNEPENAPTQRKAERSEACPPFTQAHRTLLKDMHERTKRISLNNSKEVSGCSLWGAKLTRFPFIAKTGFLGWSKSVCFTMFLSTCRKNGELRSCKTIVKYDTLWFRGVKNIVFYDGFWRNLCNKLESRQDIVLGRFLS